jgi:hypothetical protein
MKQEINPGAKVECQKKGLVVFLDFKPEFYHYL